ncbi:hypothetical protein FIBSPDRAFT_872722, partial [Athelia psychrophila]
DYDADVEAAAELVPGRFYRFQNRKSNLNRRTNPEKTASTHAQTIFFPGIGTPTNDPSSPWYLTSFRSYANPTEYRSRAQQSRIEKVWRY